MARRIQWRRDTAANWTSANPVLAQAEIGYETDEDKLKIGNGVDAWNDLPYGFGKGIVNMYTANQFPVEMAEKITAVAADKFIIEDSENSGEKRYIQATNLPAGVDTTAIHKTTADEFDSAPYKASPGGTDRLLIEDASDSLNKKYISIATLPTGADTNAVHVNAANEITGITAKTTPVSADVIILEDSEDSFNKKKLAVSDFPGGVDVSAIHKATDAELSAMAGVPLADSDIGLVEDASDSFSKGKFTMSDLANYVIGKIGLFCITKNGDQQTTSTTYVDVISWDTPNINTAGITVDGVLGTFTFTNAGTYEISYNCTNDQTTGANRNFSNHHLVLDGTEIKGTYGQTYNRNTTDGATHVAATVIITVTANQVLKMQFSTDNATYGQTILANSCAITIKRWA